MLRIIRMVVLAFGVGLPYFDHGIGNRFAVAIQHLHREQDALAIGLWTCDAADTAFVGRKTKMKKGTDSLRRCWRQVHISSRKVWPEVPAKQCRTYIQSPTGAALFPDRNGRSYAAAPFHPEPIDRWGRTRIAGPLGNTSA